MLLINLIDDRHRHVPVQGLLDALIRIAHQERKAVEDGKGELGIDLEAQLFGDVR